MGGMGDWRVWWECELRGREEGMWGVVGLAIGRSGRMGRSGRCGGGLSLLFERCIVSCLCLCVCVYVCMYVVKKGVLNEGE